MDPWIPFLSAAVGALAASIPALLLWRSQRRKNEAEAHKHEANAGKTDADAASVLTAKAMEMVARWEVRVLELEATVERQGQEIEALRCRVRKLENENDNLLNGAIKLSAQVREAGLEPDWQPA